MFFTELRCKKERGSLQNNSGKKCSAGEKRDLGLSLIKALRFMFTSGFPRKFYQFCGIAANTSELVNISIKFLKNTGFHTIKKWAEVSLEESNFDFSGRDMNFGIIKWFTWKGTFKIINSLP